MIIFNDKKTHDAAKWAGITGSGEIENENRLGDCKNLRNLTTPRAEDAPG